MKSIATAIVCALIAFGMLVWLVRQGQIAAVQKAQIEADARKAKYEQGHKFKFGITREKQ
jgi:hypothetical protein